MVHDLLKDQTLKLLIAIYRGILIIIFYYFQNNLSYTLLKDLYQRCSSREKLVKAGLKRSLFLYKKDKSKLMSKNRLNDSSLQGDEEEIDPMKIQELKMKEISKALIVLESKEEKYFQEGFNFATMESQYTLKMVLESAKDLEFDVFELQTKSVENEMYIFGMHIMAKDKYMDEFKISTKRMQNYLYALQSSYNQIAYHNKTHATDLSQTCYYYIGIIEPHGQIDIVYC